MLPGLHAAVDDARARAAATRERNRAEVAPAPEDPVAQVLVDVPLPHLDRPFEYLVPAKDGASAVPGARVKVRFAGQEVDGFVLSRRAESDHPGPLQPLRRVVSPEPVLTPAIAALTEQVALRWAGSRADVLRLAIPPRHGRTETAAPPTPPPAVTTEPGAASAAWSHVPTADAFLAHVAGGSAPRAVWQAAPGDDWPTMIAHAVRTAVAAGRGAVVCLPDHRDVERQSAALDAVLGAGQHAVLGADLGPAARYRSFLALARGHCRVAIGTRSAAYAPVADLGLAVIWDDGDDLLAEPRAPYAHVRDVLALRSETEGAAMLLGGFARSCEAALLVRSGWAHALQPERSTLRSRVRIAAVPAEDKAVGARIPRAAHDAIRAGLEHGPVLVQTPRAGYAAALACDRCRTPARCTACSGPLRQPSSTTPPTCRWCGTVDQTWTCQVCGNRGLRAPVRGEERTAEELGRMFPGTTVRSSGGDRVVAAVDERPAIVVATVGGEPVAGGGGYQSVVILDAWLTMAREDLRVEEEAVRRWLGAAGMVRPGGHVVVIGDPALPTLQAVVRWDPAGFADRELDQRASAHLPPAARLASISGDEGALSDALTLLDLPEHAEVLGPIPVESPAGPGGRTAVEHRAVVRVPLGQAGALSSALLEMQRVRSARKLDAVRVRVDPPTL